MAVYLASDCPRCRNYFGVTIAKPNGSGYQPIHGRCAPADTRLVGHSSRPDVAPTPKINKTASAERLQFLEPMYARSVQQLPEDNAWAYECKLDGYRCLAGKDSTGVRLWSRRGNVLTRDFALISQAAEHLPPDTLLDGELLAIDGMGASLNLLQHHRSQAQAILFYAST